MTALNINDLPEAIQTEIISVLGAFDSVTVERHKMTGEYKILTGTMITNAVSSYEYLGELNAKDVLSENDRILSYVRNFREYPYHAGAGGAIHYTGKKDYIKMASDDWTDVVFDPDGNIVFLNGDQS